MTGTSVSGYEVARSRLRDVSRHPFAGQSIRTLLERRSTQCASETFLVWEPFDQPRSTWTYGEFRHAVERCASALYGRGLHPGDRLLIHLNNCPEFLITWFACAWMGVVAVDTNTRAAPAELAYFIEHSEVSGAVTSPDLFESVACAGPALKWIISIDGFSELLECETEAELPSPGSFDPLCIQYTSGTTSRPKAVVWTHANGLWGARLNAAHQELDGDSVSLVVLPLFHANALGYSTLGTLHAGGTLVLQPRFSASRFWEVSIRNRCTVSCLVPFCIQALDDAPGAHSYRVWGVGISWPRVDRRFGVRTVGWWGMTETISHPIVGNGGDSDQPLSMGRPAPEYGIAVVDDSDIPVAIGETGNLLVAGIPGLSLFDHYLHDPEATRNSYDAEGWLRTGDRVRCHEDGSISFVDRAKDMLKVGGENVAASEIERVVASVAGVGEAAAVGRPDRMRGEVPVVFVVPNGKVEGGTAEGLASEIVRRCRSELADFKVPVEVHLIDEMPRVALEKVAKAELRKRLEVR